MIKALLAAMAGAVAYHAIVNKRGPTGSELAGSAVASVVGLAALKVL